MTEQEHWTAISEWRGWKLSTTKDTGCGSPWIAPDGSLDQYPPNDLNAIRAAVLALSPTEFIGKDGQVWSLRCEYLRRLEIIVFRDTGGERQEIQFELVNANSGQCAEALYGTLTNG